MIKSIKILLYSFLQIIPYAKGNKKLYFHGSEKSFAKKIIELLLWIVRDKQFNYNYYAFGLNLKNKKLNSYIGRTEFLKLKNQTEQLLRKKKGAENLSYDVITKDKFVSYAYFSANSIPCVPVMGLVSKDQIIFTNGKTGQIKELFEIKYEFVLKNIVLEAGDGFILCKPFNNEKLIINQQETSLQQLRTTIGNDQWVLQQKVQSHGTICKINNTALNTTRIVTILNGKEAIFIGGFQSFATGGETIDSWSKGSIYVGFDPNKSVLIGPGYYHPEIDDKSLAVQHPDTGISFDDFQIPFLKESVELCLRAHCLLYNHFVIGWDVVITDAGPLILEANEKPGMNAVQCVEGGLRHKIKTSFVNTIKYGKNQLWT